MVARELGGATAVGLSWLLEHDDPELPIDSIARLALTTMTLDEALMWHEQMRTALLKVAGDEAIVVGGDS